MDSLFTIGGFTFGLVAVGVLSGLLFWFVEDGLTQEITKNKWLLPVIGGFGGVGVYILLFRKYY